MKKRDLIARVAENTGVSKKTTGKVINDLFRTLRETLEAEKSVEVEDLGIILDESEGVSAPKSPKPPSSKKPKRARAGRYLAKRSPRPNTMGARGGGGGPDD